MKRLFVALILVVATMATTVFTTAAEEDGSAVDICPEGQVSNDLDECVEQEPLPHADPDRGDPDLPGLCEDRVTIRYEEQGVDKCWPYQYRFEIDFIECPDGWVARSLPNTVPLQVLCFDFSSLEAPAESPPAMEPTQVPDQSEAEADQAETQEVRSLPSTGSGSTAPKR